MINLENPKQTCYEDGMEEDKSPFKILTGNPTGTRPLGKRMRRWEDSIRMDLKEIGINMKSWIVSAHDKDN